VAFSLCSFSDKPVPLSQVTPPCFIKDMSGEVFFFFCVARSGDALVDDERGYDSFLPLTEKVFYEVKK
jgi:hypothetical protein